MRSASSVATARFSASVRGSDIVRLAIGAGVFLLLDLARVAQRVAEVAGVGRLFFEQLLGFLEALGLAAAVLGRGALGLVHPLHAAAPADPSRFRCGGFLLFAHLDLVRLFLHGSPAARSAPGLN